MSMTLTGLTPATTYRYRLVAKSDAGTTYATDATFSTSGVTLTVLARQVVFGGRVTLSGVVPPHQAGQQVVVFAQPFGGGSFQMGRPCSPAQTAPGPIRGARDRHGLRGELAGRDSAPVSIGVHPSIALRQTTAKSDRRQGRRRTVVRRPARPGAALVERPLVDDQACAAGQPVAGRSSTSCCRREDPRFGSRSASTRREQASLAA